LALSEAQGLSSGDHSATRKKKRQNSADRKGMFHFAISVLKEFSWDSQMNPDLK
jgi:hypothetical protein